MSPLETVTVLFADLVGSTRLAAQVGPARADELRVEYFALLRTAVAEAGGREVKNTGDGVMAAFASAAAAVACGVAIQQGADWRNRGAAEELAVRIGVNLGDATAEDGDYHGMTVTLAARLCDAATAGQILASELVRAMVEPRSEHAFTEVAPLELKGVPQPVRAAAVAWEPLAAGASAALPPRLRQAGQLPYVGREGARARLAAVGAAAARDGLRVALVAGEPGIGKTRLATELAAGAAARGATVLYGRCDEDPSVSHGPWLEALSHLVEHADDALLARHVDRHGNHLARLLPGLASRVPAGADARSADPATERYLMWGAVAGLLADAAGEAPVVLVLDDLHWADAPTLALLKHVVATAREARVLVIGTYRDTDVTREHPFAAVLADLRGEPTVERIGLGGLAPDDVVGLMAAAVGDELDESARRLAADIGDETGGNPFFVAELTRHLAETGALRRGEDGRWSVDAAVAPAGLPQGVREVVERRVRRLGDEVLHVLSVGAVIGRDVELSLLAHVLETSEDEVLDVLDEAVGAAVLVEVADAPGRFSFAHALINHTLYEELGATRRGRLHRRVAQALEELAPDRIAELAQHWGAVAAPAEPAKALDYARRAGGQALADLAPDGAVAWLVRALALLDAGAATDETQRCEVLIDLGEARRQLSDGRYRADLIEAARLARGLGDGERLTRAALAAARGQLGLTGAIDPERVEALEAALALAGPDDLSARARLTAALAVELLFVADTERRHALAHEALALVRRTDDDAALARVLRDASIALEVPATLALRVELVDELGALATRLGDPELQFWANFRRGHLAGEHGDFAAVDAGLSACRRIADEIGHPGLRWTCGIPGSARLRVAGDLAASEALTLRTAQTGDAADAWIVAAQLTGIRWEQGRMAEMLELMHRMGRENPGMAGFDAAGAVILCESGGHDEARALLAARSSAGFDDVPLDVAWMTTMCLWAHTAHVLGARADSATISALLRPWEDRVVWDNVNALGPVDHYLGELAVTLDDAAAAHRHFERARATAARIPAPLWGARAALEQGRLLLGSDPERARELLRDAARDARAGAAAGTAAAAEALLTEP